MTALAADDSMSAPQIRTLHDWMPAEIDPETRRDAERDHFADQVRAVADFRDRAAFERLYRHFAPRLKTYGLKLGADAAAAEELAQEAMLSLWRKAASFDPEKASVSTWLFTIVRNRRIDVLRRESRPQPAEADLLGLMAPAETADSGAHAQDDERRVAHSLDDLPLTQRQIVEMAYFEDKSHSEIARDLALPLGTVKSRIRLALARLRDTLERS